MGVKDNVQVILVHPTVITLAVQTVLLLVKTLVCHHVVALVQELVRNRSVIIRVVRLVQELVQVRIVQELVVADVLLIAVVVKEIVLATGVPVVVLTSVQDQDVKERVDQDVKEHVVLHVVEEVLVPVVAIMHVAETHVQADVTILVLETHVLVIARLLVKILVDQMIVQMIVIISVQDVIIIVMLNHVSLHVKKQLASAIVRAIHVQTVANKLVVIDVPVLVIMDVQSLVGILYI